MYASAPRGPKLPSIRTLHPYLPPPPPSAHAPMPSISGLQHTHATINLGSPMPYDNPNPSSASYHNPDPDVDPDADHDQDAEADGSGRPSRKKRRRQSLSCTECKRRKIRCDRSHPCAPCVRRGDQAKCQWHVESVTEKYVPLAEHHSLRARVDALETFIAHLPPAVREAMPPPPAAAQSVSSFSSSGANSSTANRPNHPAPSGLTLPIWDSTPIPNAFSMITTFPHPPPGHRYGSPPMRSPQPPTPPSLPPNRISFFVRNPPPPQPYAFTDPGGGRRSGGGRGDTVPAQMHTLQRGAEGGRAGRGGGHIPSRWE
ncbi:hypothetical protein B0H11DRAFT_1007276 [Mycena galericulata]|nr:hypothetical protein B0H11DRAFT_49548 [Mycena galericulata]KAJ7491342.1 hypothetical protein B0H11DRAFT_1007276 [Mycena galericulata]